MATTGEHRIKHSDLKKLYPNISQQQPLYHRRNGIKQKSIGCIKSNRLKFDTLICARCNNETTQPYDIAWSKLSNYIQDNWYDISTLNRINLQNIFDNVNSSMIKVQLFFTKIFGCYIKEYSVPIQLSSFSESLLNCQEHQSLYLSFRKSEIETKGNYAALSDIEIYYNKNIIYYAHMFYTLGQLTVDLIYAPNAEIIDLNGAIKPNGITNGTIELSKLNYKSSLPVCIQSLMKDN